MRAGQRSIFNDGYRRVGLAIDHVLQLAGFGNLGGIDGTFRIALLRIRATGKGQPGSGRSSERNNVSAIKHCRHPNHPVLFQ